MTSTVSSYFSKNSKRPHSSGSSESETPVKPSEKKAQKKKNTAAITEEGPSMSVQETLTVLGQRMDAIMKQLDTLATKDDIQNLKSEVETLNQSFSEKIEQLEGRLLDSESKIDQIQKNVQTLEKNNETLKDRVIQQNRQIQQLQTEQNNLQQYSRRWNLRVFRVPEREGETSDGCIKKCCDIFSQQVKVVTGVSEVEVAHRTGQPSGSKPRPILVRFFDRKKRDQILANKKNLKGKGVVVGEDLTQASYRVYREAMQHSARMSVWTANGNVIAKLKNGKTVKLDIHTDVNQTFRRLMAEQMDH